MGSPSGSHAGLAPARHVIRPATRWRTLPGMGEKVIGFVVIVVAVIIGFSILGFILKALWWMAVIAGGIVLAALVLNKMGKA